jgi:iron complex transport system substrate-binding protein
MEHKETKSVFSIKNLDDILRIWNDTSISLQDIRHNLIPPNENIEGYHMPSNAFIYTIGAKAKVFLNDTPYQMERTGMFHGGKDTQLSIYPLGSWIEYYIVFYRAGESPFHRLQYAKLLKSVNPFLQQYGFTPSNPIFLTELLKKMFECWKHPTPLETFYEKSAFYQLVYEIYKELQQEQIDILLPDVVTQVKWYIKNHYQELIYIQTLATALQISRSQLHKLFVQQEGKSPQEYLMDVRLSQVKRYLVDTDFSIREIAYACGFANEFTLMKTFRKHQHMTAGEYRDKMAYLKRHEAMDYRSFFLYNEQGQVSIDKLFKEGERNMIRQIKHKALISAALSMLLLLTACSTTPVNTGTTDNSPTTEAVTQIPDTVAAEKDTRTIHLEYGDVEIPKEPKNVIIAYNQGDLLALGITPVGATFSTGAAFEDLAKNITEIDGWSVNPEELMSLNPDLIIWGSYNEKDYDTLSKIAPTLAGDFFSMTYEERLSFFGEVFNRSEKAEELINEFNQKLSDSREKLQEAGLIEKSVSCVEVRDGLIRAFQYGRGGNLVYDMLGLSAPTKLRETFENEESVDLSYEVIHEYMGDFILLNAGADTLIDNEMWENLPAVKEGRVIQASSDMFWFNDIISLSAQIDVITNSMLESSK